MATLAPPTATVTVKDHSLTVTANGKTFSTPFTPIHGHMVSLDGVVLDIARRILKDNGMAKAKIGQVNYQFSPPSKNTNVVREPFHP